MKILRDIILTLVVIIDVILLAFVFDDAEAAEVNLAWDASPSPGVTGHKIGVGTDDTLSLSTLLVANVTSAAVTDLTPGVTYHFGVKAYNPDAESVWSNIVTYTPPLVIQPPIVYPLPESVPPQNFYVNANLGVRVSFAPRWIAGTTSATLQSPGGTPATSTRTSSGTFPVIYNTPGTYTVTFSRTVYGIIQSETKQITIVPAGHYFK